MFDLRRSTSVLTEVMKQIGIDIRCLPHVDGYKCVVVWIDGSVKANHSKTNLMFPLLISLYELKCRHGCFSIQINDQWMDLYQSVMNSQKNGN